MSRTLDDKCHGLFTTETQRHRDTEKASKEESDVLCLSSPPEIVYAWKFIPSAPRKSNENPEFDVYSLVP
jgi:hypothetical protein